MNSTILLLLFAGGLAVFIYSLNKKKLEQPELSPEEIIQDKENQGICGIKILGSTKDSEEINFVKNLFADVAANISPIVNIEAENLQLLLIKWWMDKEKSELLDKVHSIECGFIKKSPSMIQSTLTVALFQNKEMITRRFEYDFEWEYIPKDIRSDFIRNPGNERLFVLCE
jgi:hypothetical protein